MIGEYFYENFYLIIIVGGMLFVLIDNLLEKRKNAVFGIAILSLALILSISNMIQRYATQNDFWFLATLGYYLGISLRPLVLFFFIRLAEEKLRINKWILLIPLMVNATLYLSSFFLGVDWLHHLTFYIHEGADGLLEISTDGPLFLSSHIISLLYLGYLLFICIVKLNGKDYLEGISLLICSIAVIVAAILGTLRITRNLLNTTIAISTVFYYLFLTQQQNKKDPLTGLYNRQSYYKDTLKYVKQVDAVIQIDMNGLKYINDTQGHEEGDKALIAVASAITKFAGKSTFSYRLGGDEFIVLMMNADKKIVSRFVEDVGDFLAEGNYPCAIGYALRENGETIGDLVTKAETFMYQQKNEFYKNSTIERRHSKPEPSDE